MSSKLKYSLNNEIESTKKIQKLNFYCNQSMSKFKTLKAKRNASKTKLAAMESYMKYLKERIAEEKRVLTTNKKHCFEEMIAANKTTEVMMEKRAMIKAMVLDELVTDLRQMQANSMKDNEPEPRKMKK